MAGTSTPSRFASTPALELLAPNESIADKSKAAVNQLIVVLFNVEFPERGSIESRLRNWRHMYEQKNIRFFKYVMVKDEQEQKKQLEIKRSPTFVFFYNGLEDSRLDNLDEGNPKIAATTTSSGEASKDEKTVKAKLDELYEKYKAGPPNATAPTQ